MNTRTSENGNLYRLTNNTGTINYTNNSSTFTSSVRWVKLSRRKEARLWQGVWHLHVHGTMNMLNVSTLSSVQFCYFGSRVFFKIWNFFLSYQKNVDFSGTFWDFPSSYSVDFYFLPSFFFKNRKQLGNCTYAREKGRVCFFPLCNLLVDRKSSNWYSLF